MPRKYVFVALGIAAGVFFAMKCPVQAIPDLGRWTKSVLSPMIDPMFPLGVGIITFVTSGLINIRSSLPFGALELAVLAAAVIWYFFNCKRYPNTAPLLAILPLFFAWRSIWSYFFYAALILLAGVLASKPAQVTGDPTTTPEPFTSRSSNG